MKSNHLIPLGVTAILTASLGCAQPTSDLEPAHNKKKGITKTFQEDPTKGQAQAPGAYAAGDKNTFDHFDDLIHEDRARAPTCCSRSRPAPPRSGSAPSRSGDTS